MNILRWDCIIPIESGYNEVIQQLGKGFGGFMKMVTSVE